MKLRFPKEQLHQFQFDKETLLKGLVKEKVCEHPNVRENFLLGVDNVSNESLQQRS